MKVRFLSLTGSKKSLTALLVAVLLALFSQILMAQSNNESIKECFYNSVIYKPSKGILYFTIPKTIPDNYKLYLHISGRLFMGNEHNGMSFHAYDNESINYTWEYGKTYKYSLMAEGLDFVDLDFGLLNKSNWKLDINYTIHILQDGTKAIYKN